MNINKLYIEYSDDPGWDYNNGYPSGKESVWNWEEKYTPVEHKKGDKVIGPHKWRRERVGINSEWSYPQPLIGSSVVKVDFIFAKIDSDKTYYYVRSTYDDGLVYQSPDTIYVLNGKDGKDASSGSQTAPTQWFQSVSELQEFDGFIHDVRYGVFGTETIYRYDQFATTGIKPNSISGPGRYVEDYTIGGAATPESIKALYEQNPDTNAFTDNLLSKLNGIESGAEVNVQADWSEGSVLSDAYIKNKPTDVTDLSLHSATELNDINDVGSRSIITDEERQEVLDLRTDLSLHTGDDSIHFTEESINHNSISNVDQANAGVTNGHISDQPQTIYGGKTFNDDITASNNLTVIGDLFVSGSRFEVQGEEVSTSDNIIEINKGEVGNGVTVGSAGIEVDRGTAVNYQFIFDESDDWFKVGEIGDLQRVATIETSPTNGEYTVYNSTTSQLETKQIDSDEIAEGGVNLFNRFPVGGLLNQFLKKASAIDFDAAWGYLSSLWDSAGNVVVDVLSSKVTTTRRIVDAKTVEVLSEASTVSLAWDTNKIYKLTITNEATYPTVNINVNETLDGDGDVPYYTGQVVSLLMTGDVLVKFEQASFTFNGVLDSNGNSIHYNDGFIGQNLIQLKCVDAANKIFHVQVSQS